MWRFLEIGALVDMENPLSHYMDSGDVYLLPNQKSLGIQPQLQLF